MPGSFPETSKFTVLKSSDGAVGNRNNTNFDETGMNISEAQTQLTLIRDHLPAEYSLQAARRLMSSFENYRQISLSLGRSVSRINTGIRTEFEDIEGDIRMAIKGTPKKTSESAFIQARRHITDDINLILAVIPPPPASD